MSATPAADETHSLLQVLVQVHHMGTGPHYWVQAFKFR